MFTKLLVANRGEIAVRVIRGCRELGVSPVAVFSEPDRLSPHVLLADDAVPIGSASASESYLSFDKLLDAARRTGAEAVHPGYGFLAENAAFARAVVEAGLVWVGPPAEAIEAMGDKTEARRRMESAGVPVVPGSGAAAEVEEALEAAAEVGYPVMLKAAAGGGGKGMRVAEDEDALRRGFPRARSEAQQAFGDGRIYLERLLDGPRHIEVQVLADGEGTTVHLGERECSIQRRHQKLVEEAPSPAVDADLRRRMGEVAVRAAEAVDYVGAGTVEFLFQDGEFFFLEMNTRIQVEHPVTELVTGVDLVAEQIRIAAGELLGWEPDPEWPRGHAIECRITAEDPAAGFLPAGGRIIHLREPSGPGVRWDGGIAEGFEVGLSYDPLLAKLVVHGPDREAAIDRMRRALSELRVDGVATSQPFHLAVMEEPDFRAGRLTIGYVDAHPDLLEREDPVWRDAAVAAAVLLEEEARHGVGDGGPRPRAGRGAGAGAGAGGGGADRRETPGSPRGRPLSAWQRAFAPDGGRDGGG